MLLKAIFLPTTQRKQFYMPPKKTAGLCGDLPPTVAGSTPKLLLLPHMTAPTAGHLHRPSSYKTGGVRIGATFLSEEIQVPAEWTRRQGLSVWWSKRHRTRPGTSRCKHHLICKSFPTALLVWNTPTPFTPSSGLYLKKKKNWSMVDLGFPGSSAGKESACNAEDPSLITGLGRSPREGLVYPLQYLGLPWWLRR